MSEASRLRAELVRLFGGDKGRALTIRRITPGTYVPATGATGAATETDYTGTGRLGTYADSVIDGTLIRADDRKVTWVPGTAALAFLPRPGDLVIAGADTDDIYSVITVKTRELAAENICHTLQVRNA